MIRQSAPPSTPEERLFSGAVTAVAVVLVVLYAFLSSDLPAGVRELTSFIGLIGGGIVASVACRRRGLRSTGRRRRSWMLISAACALGAAGNTWYALHEYGVTPDDNVTDGALLLAGLCGVAAILLFPTAQRRRTDSARMLLDGIVVGGSILYIVSVTVFPELLEAEDVEERIASLILPVFDAMLATLAVLLILRGRREDRTTLALLSVGMVLYAASDLTYAVVNAESTYTFGAERDLGWIAGYGLIVLAALHSSRGAGSDLDEVEQEMSPLWGTVLMFGLFLAAASVSLFWEKPAPVERPAGAMLVGVMLAVAARQILLIMDNDKLRQGLERRVMERTAELAKLTEQRELLLSSVGDGIYGVDRDGRVTFANPAALTILGRESDALIGLPAHETFHGLQPDGTPYPLSHCYVTEAIESGIRAHGEEDTYRRLDGKEIPVEVTASPLTSAEGIVGAVVGFRDVTERREVDRMKSEFVSVVSHELRTPLTAIRGSLGLISGGAVGALPPRAAHMVTIALESSERLTRLINDILDIERIEAGTTPMDIADHSAAELIDAAIAQVQVIAANAGVRLDVRQADGDVHADRDRIVQALLNLLGNAIKFSPRDTVIEVESDVDGDMVSFRVSDHGRGIPTDKLGSIFNRFEQVDSSDAREKGGTGLGLAISRSIVERHGGRIWAESGPDGGATFRFTLPRAASPVDRSGARTERASVIVHGVDPTAVGAVTTDLDTHGYRCLTLTTAPTVIAQAEMHRPAAIVLVADSSPEAATQLVTALRRNPETQEVPVVVVSDRRPAEFPTLAACADGWVAPGSGDDLLVRTLVTAVLGQRARGVVLVVEDDEDLADVIRALLERRGLLVHHARTKVEALSRCAFSRPNVLILDRVLPDGNGVELVASLREQEKLADLPVIVYSSAEVRPEERDGLRLGRTVYLSKGRATPQQLEAYVVELIGRTIVNPDAGRSAGRSHVRSSLAGPAPVLDGTAGAGTPAGVPAHQGERTR
jgi:PAS domain S-box-containing protein